MAKNKQIIEIVKDLKDLTGKAIKKITLDLTANLVEVTPVDIGWARANWVPSIGRPSLPRTISGKPTAGQLSAKEGKQEQGLAKVATQYTLDQGVVFVSNNVPYILRLNDGHSQQEPAGFIQRAITKAVTVDFKGFS